MTTGGDQKQSIITKETLLPIGVVAAILMTFIGGVIYIVNIQNDLQQQKSEVVKLEARVNKLELGSSQTLVIVTEIKTKLDILLDKNVLN